MSVLEIVLIIMGIIIFIGSFLIPERKNSSVREAAVDEKEIHDLVDKEVEEARGKINDIVDETITYAMEKTERSMDRLTNEKMMAVNEYSDTVLSEINKNHQEVVFLYDMLNDKHENLKNTVTEVEKTAKEVRQTVKDAELTAKELTPGPEKQQSADFEPLGTAKGFSPEKITLVGDQPTAGEPVVEAALQTKETAAKKTAGTAKARTRAVVEADRENNKKDTTEHALAGKTKTAGKSRDGKSKAEIEVPDVTVSLDKKGKSGARNSNEAILELHKAGKSNMAIAKELGLGIGEVKLVIDLFEGM